LTRQVGPGDRTAVFILRNPSTADAVTDDPTIRRSIVFARQWGCGRLALNLFAFRATDPADLKQAEEPVGPETREWFDRTLRADHDGRVAYGWGVLGEHHGQDGVILGWLAALRVRPFALGLTRDGHPKHLLYLPKGAELRPYSSRQAPAPAH
jgi:hypothetical protein